MPPAEHSGQDRAGADGRGSERAAGIEPAHPTMMDPVRTPAHGAMMVANSIALHRFSPSALTVPLLSRAERY